MKISNFKFSPLQRDPVDCGKISNNNGFTLIEALVGVALVIIVFMGIFGAYRLALKIVSMSKDKITATAIANSQLEIIRNLPYSSVGLKNATLPMVLGDIDPIVTKMINNITYTVATSVQYVVDAADGTGASDQCDWDYKRADVTVSWEDSFSGNLTLSAMVAPENQVQELQSCQNQPGGVLGVTVFNAAGVIVPSPLIEIRSMPGNVFVSSATPSDGSYSFPLVAGTYRISVLKNGYSSVRTYDSGEVAVPNDPDLMVFEGQVTSKSLPIDAVSAFSLDSISPNGFGTFADSFADQSLLSQLSNTQAASGAIKLSGPPYPSSGFAISNEIVPGDLVSWNQLVFTGVKPSQTNITYQVLYFNGASWVLVPNTYISGNSTGLTSSPIQLSSLPAGTYTKLKIKANLSTTNNTVTPQVNSWEVTWISSTGVPIPNVSLHLAGQKTIGKNSSGQNVYKYAQDFSTNGSGHADLANLEWDSYVFSVGSASASLVLIGSDPAPQPISVAPGATANVKLYLQAQNALLVTVQDSQSLDPLFSATVRLVNSGIGYDMTQNTDQNGQTYFAPLNSGTYTLSIQEPGYANYSGSVSVSGRGATLINLIPS
jgi:type II secretory pathway pseudopilin PulG